MSRERYTENPFYVLGLRPDCSRADMEREGQKLLGLLELNIGAARSYPTPLGVMPRTAEAVRAAMGELRDPQRRLLHELWAQLPAEPLAAPAPEPASESAPGPAADDGPPPWPQARAALGFGGRR
jgi:hypothetical protein